MATREEMAAFKADQRHIPCENVAEAAKVALQLFCFDERDRQYFQSLQNDNGNVQWINLMTHDQKSRFVWIHGNSPVLLTYRESNWIGDPVNLAKLKPHHVGHA